MNKLKSILMTGGLVLGMFQAQAQVSFKIERMGETNNFLVSAVSNVDYTNPKNITSTAQVTLMAPTGDFEMSKIVNLYPNASWRLNGRTNAPKENPSQDYIYFGLENLGTNAFDFKKGKDIPLFVVQSKVCESNLSLMDNKHDAFMFPNSKQINVGNQMTVLGAGGDAYTGLVDGKGHADCLVSTKAANISSYQLRIMPNITSEGNVKVEFLRNDKENEAGEITVYDEAGRALVSQKVQAKKGYNNVELDVSTLVNGSYFVMLTGVKITPITERLVIFN